MDRFRPKTTFPDLKRGLELFNNSFRLVSVSAEEAAAAFERLVKEINKTVSKEYKIMEMKLILMKARLQTLDGRNTECESIRKKLRRQIRNLEAVMAA